MMCPIVDHPDCFLCDSFPLSIRIFNGIQKEGVSLENHRKYHQHDPHSVLDSCTALRIYFRITDSTKFDLVKDSVTFGGIASAPITATSDGKYIYFEYANIEAAKLNNSYTLSINGSDYHYSVADFLRLARNKAETTADDRLMQLVTSIYWYNVYADAYFGED